LIEEHHVRFFSRSNRGRHRCRPRRTFPLANAAVEVLDVRSLLSSAAVIQWSMVPQIAPDPLHGNEPDLPNTPVYVNPPGGYGVVLDASHSGGIKPTTIFAWTVTDSAGHATYASGEKPTIRLALGPYTVELTATGLRGSKRPQFAMVNIQVKDVLIVSIGDSYASGEGNPVVPSMSDPQWAYSPDPAMNTENANAHRSTIAGPAQFALKLQEFNPHEAVTFVSVANSGASIPVGVLGPMQSIGDPNYQLPGEIAELEQLIGTRHIDVLTVTLGADDVGFATIAEDLGENTLLGSPSVSTILSQFNDSLAALPQHFADLAQAIQSLNPSEVLVTGYPDITRDQNGNVAAIVGPDNFTLINQADAEVASRQIIPPLNAGVAAAANTYDWTLVRGINADFLRHGYPSTNPWIVTLGQSVDVERNQDGTLHPNAAGHKDIAVHLLDTYLGLLGKAKTKIQRDRKGHKA
jgi:GDSL-like Lipase/Acylhydrolase family